MKMYSFAPLVFVAALSAQQFLPTGDVSPLMTAHTGTVTLALLDTGAESGLYLPESIELQNQRLVQLEAGPSGQLPTPTPKPVVKPVVTATPPPQPSATPTPVVPATPALAPHELDALFQKYGAEYGVSWEKLKVIAKCESGFRANAIGGGGKYGGMYQYLASTWSSTRNAMGLDPNPDLRFNAEEAIRTTAWKIAQGGTGPWPVCGKK